MSCTAACTALARKPIPACDKDLGGPALIRNRACIEAEPPPFRGDVEVRPFQGIG